MDQVAQNAPTWIGIVSILVGQLIRWRKANRRDRARDKALTDRLAQLENTVQEAKGQARDAAEHAASMNRKLWRQTHPGQETPDPTLEPRSYVGPNPLFKGKKP